MTLINLSDGWNLRGARNTVELNAIINALRTPDASGRIGDCDRAARVTGASRDSVSSVARWYQSLWMRN